MYLAKFSGNQFDQVRRHNQRCGWSQRRLAAVRPGVPADEGRVRRVALMRGALPVVLGSHSYARCGTIRAIGWSTGLCVGQAVGFAVGSVIGLAIDHGAGRRAARPCGTTGASPRCHRQGGSTVRASAGAISRSVVSLQLCLVILRST